MKQGRTLVDLAQEIQRQTESKRDFKASTKHLRMASEDDNSSRLWLEGMGAFPINPLAHEQIGDRVGIPRKYYEKMRTEAPELLDRNVNHWFHSKPETRMVRTLDGRARAFLSDRFRPLDNYDLAEVAVDTIMKQGCRVESCELTERRLYIKAVTERITAEVSVGDIVQAGIVVSNSEVGCGALKVEPMIWTLSCKNGMISKDNSLRRHHVGRGDGDVDGTEEYYLDETRLADDKAFWMKARDVINGSFNEEIFARLVGRLKEAKEEDLDQPVEVVEMVAKRFSFTDTEKDGVLANLIKGGDVSRYGLVNAVTRMSQDIEDYDRATDIERMGGLILELPKADFKVA